MIFRDKNSYATTTEVIVMVEDLKIRNRLSNTVDYWRSSNGLVEFWCMGIEPEWSIHASEWQTVILTIIKGF